jgi:nitronate monooxygenase
MRITPPKIIQGGMGAGVSNWRLARAVSQQGQLGVVSGTALDMVLARRLQSGDPGGHIRSALEHFPLREIARRIVDTLYVAGGKGSDEPYRPIGMHAMEGSHWPQALCIAGNFVEVFLARQGHNNPVGINYLEKIQMPHLPSLYGAMLAGVAVVIVGAGVPLQFPAALDLLTGHNPTRYRIDVSGSAPDDTDTDVTFDPRSFWDAGMDSLPPLTRPDFLPIIASDTLAVMLHRRIPDAIAGFIIEGPCAGGHNAPPRGRLQLSEKGEPIYGPRDVVNLEAIRALGLPFWLAGGYGSPEGLRFAKEHGAAGVQVGTAFALCEESGLDPDVKRTLIAKALAGDAAILTGALTSPTGFPFKIAELDDSLSDDEVYQHRKRICDLGFLRQVYRRKDGAFGYRCPAEPRDAYVAKGGKAEDTVGRKCLCNALIANIGMPQSSGDGVRERCLVTLGEDFAGIGRFCDADHPDYTAADVTRVLLGAVAPPNHSHFGVSR